MMTWSRHSRRTLPRKHSQVALTAPDLRSCSSISLCSSRVWTRAVWFMRGARTAVLSTRMPVPFGRAQHTPDGGPKARSEEAEHGCRSGPERTHHQDWSPADFSTILGWAGGVARTGTSGGDRGRARSPAPVRSRIRCGALSASPGRYERVRSGRRASAHGCPFPVNDFSSPQNDRAGSMTNERFVSQFQDDGRHIRRLCRVGRFSRTCASSGSPHRRNTRAPAPCLSQ